MWTFLRAAVLVEVRTRVNVVVNVLREQTATSADEGELSNLEIV